MPKAVKQVTVLTPTRKGTSIGRNPISSTMNKDKKRGFKKYRGQGKS